MKRVILLSLIFISVNLYSQDMNRVSVGISYGLNSIIQDEAIVASEIVGEQSNSVEIRYTRMLSKSLRKQNSWGVESGIIYSSHEFVIKEVNESTLEKISVVTIPAYARLNFLTHFYASAGAIVSFELNSTNLDYRSSQNGVGLGAELGGEYQINKNIALQLGTFIRQYNILPFSQTTSHDAISEFGLKLAVSYYF